MNIKTTYEHRVEHKMHDRPGWWHNPSADTFHSKRSKRSKLASLRKAIRRANQIERATGRKTRIVQITTETEIL